ESRPSAGSCEAVGDVDAVVRTVLARTGARQVTLLGWASGGLWAGQSAALWPERVGHLVLLNALYGGSATHSMFGPGSSLADTAHPDRLSPSLGGYARADAASLLRPWDRSVGDDPTARRDPAGAQAYVREAPASDPPPAPPSPVAPCAARGAGGQLLPGLRAPALRRGVDQRRGAARPRQRRLLEPPRGRSGVCARRGPRPERPHRGDPRRNPLPAPRAGIR